MEENATGSKLPQRMAHVEGHLKGAEKAWATLSGGSGSGNSGGAKHSQAAGGNDMEKCQRGAGLRA